MSAKCVSPNCSRKSDSANNQNLCVLCYDWFLKCQSQVQPQCQTQTNNHQELLNIYNSLANGIHVDHTVMMKALFGSILGLMDQNNQIIGLKEEIQTLAANVKDLENDLTGTKVKVFNLEYDMKSLEKEQFSSKDTIVNRNLAMPLDGNEEKKVIEVLGHLALEEVDFEEDILAVERKGNSQGRLGSVLVKLVNGNIKKLIMKKKKVLLEHSNNEVREIKIVNYKPQEHIIFENALRSVLALVPNGERYELNGNMRLVTKQN